MISKIKRTDELRFRISLTSLSRLFHSYRDEPIGRWGETGVTRENHLTPRKLNLACLTCGQCGARTHTSHSGEMIESLRALKFSDLTHSATGAANSDWCDLLQRLEQNGPKDEKSGFREFQFCFDTVV